MKKRNNSDLDELAEAILQFVNKKKSVKPEKIIDSFSSNVYSDNAVKAHIRVLENKSYIKKEDRIVGAFGGSDEDVIREIGVYAITPLGENRLSKVSANFTTTNYENISNANIAHNSSNSTQSISEYKKVLQKKKNPIWVSDHISQIVTGIIITVIGGAILFLLGFN